jgi:hypothetical protein
MATDTMRFSVSGPDPAALTTAIAELPVFAGPPASLDVDRARQAVTPDWLTRWLPRAKKHVQAAWSNGSTLWHSDTCVLAVSRSFADDLPGLARFVTGLPFELAAFWTPHAARWAAAGYRPRGFAGGHIQNGWGCMFKGAGHDRLVSRRWLEHGPWRMTRHPGDVSQLELYDLRADADTAMAQAKRGSERLGISPTGGFLQKPYVYASKLDGVYDARARTYKIPVASRTLKQSEMLDACGLRAERRGDPEAPIECAGFAFVMGKDEAAPYVHELWLRELGCWAVVDGADVRLDDSHTPTPEKPPW